MTLGVSAVENISPAHVPAGHRPWHDPTLRSLPLGTGLCVFAQTWGYRIFVCPAGFQSYLSPILPWYSPIPPLCKGNVYTVLLYMRSF
jgi:hypothetical protein